MNLSLDASAGFAHDWRYAFGTPDVTGALRTVPEDFVVEEELGFEPDGHGDHLFLQVRKRDANTAWVARRLAQVADIAPLDVGYAGLKDRRAVTTQWFSLQLPEKSEPDFAELAGEGIEVLVRARHSCKLRRGELRGNRFTLVVRDLRGDPAGLDARLKAIAGRGVPNYFGPQRFGRDGGNLAQALALFRGERQERDRQLRGLYLSAARSWLFNAVLSERVADGSWERILPGECVMLDGSDQWFIDFGSDPASLAARLAAFDIHPSGPLWGRGPVPAKGKLAALERAVVEPFAAFRLGLEQAGLRQERRALRLPVRDLRWQQAGDTLELRFSLPPGAYATSVLREVVATQDATGEDADG